MTNSTTFPGTVTATSYEGSGANLTGISAGFDPNVDIIKIGNGAGTTTQGINCIAIGHDAGSSGTQGDNSVAVGHAAGQVSQGDSATAIGDRAGSASQGYYATAVGNYAGYNAQGTRAVAVGRTAGQTSQGSDATAIGPFAGSQNQGAGAVAIGVSSGNQNQGASATAIGPNSGYASQGTYGTSIGFAAGFISAHQYTLNLCGNNNLVNTSGASRFHVKPIRNYGALSYDSSTAEIYGNSSDDRVKHNESYIKNALKTIMKLKPQTYDKASNLESDSNAYIEHHESGFMAQDIWYDVPEMKHIVILAETANPTPEKPPAPSDDPADDPDYSAWGADLSTLNYTQVIPFLTKAVQEISVEIPRVKTTVSNTWGQNITGLVVSANTNKHKTNTVPMVNLSTVSMDKSWYGVVSDEKTDSIEYDTLVDIKGDSRIWVTDTTGPLESGDLITTSNVATGYTQKQSDDIVRNYTIGKITQDCDFTEPSTITLKVPKRELSNVTYYIHQEKSTMTKNDYDNCGLESGKMAEVVTGYRRIDDEKQDPLFYLSQKMYDDLLGEAKRHFTPITKTEYYRLVNYETKFPHKGHTIEEIRQELVDVLDENGQTVWEETGETQPVYTLVDHGTYKAALVICKLI